MKSSLKSNSVIIYLTDIDASKDNGAGINERGFLSAIARHNEVISILPYPRFPDTYFDKKHVYVYGHFGKWWRYTLYIIHLCYCLCVVSYRYKVKALALRLGLSPFIPLIYSYICRVPLLLKTYPGIDPHENIPWKKLLFNWKSLRVRLQHYLLQSMYRAIVRKSILVDCPSDNCRASVINDKKIPASKVIAIPNGANVDFFKPLNRSTFREKYGFKESDKVVGYIGALNGAIRFTDYLIDGLENLLKIRNDTILLLVGDGQNKRTLEEKCRKKNILENVQFTGFVTNRLIPEYMSVLDVAVDLTAVPVQVDEQIRYASYSQKIGQYLSCGVPVIAWDIEDTYFIRENLIGGLAKLFDAVDLAEKINQVLSLNTSNWKNTSQRARLYALDNYSYSIIAEKRLKLWNIAIDGTAP